MYKPENQSMIYKQATIEIKIEIYSCRRDKVFLSGLDSFVAMSVEFNTYHIRTAGKTNQ